MKRNLLLLSLLCAFTFTDLLAGSPTYIRTKDGIIVFTDPVFTGTSRAAQSLVTVYTKRPDFSWDVIPSKDCLTLITKILTAVVDLKTGAGKKMNDKDLVNLNS